MKWLVIGTIGLFGFYLGKENPEIAAAIIIAISLMTIGFFIAPQITWFLISIGVVCLGVWLLFYYWYIWAMMFMGFFFFIGLLMSIGAVLS